MVSLVRECPLWTRARMEAAESNRQREKTFSQKMREAEHLERIEVEIRERERREKISRYRQTGETVDARPPSKSRDAVAEAVGIGSGR